MWTLDIQEKVFRRLERIPEPESGRLADAILSLENGTAGKDIRKLQGRSGYRLRVGG